MCELKIPCIKEACEFHQDEVSRNVEKYFQKVEAWIASIVKYECTPPYKGDIRYLNLNMLQQFEMSILSHDEYDDTTSILEQVWIVTQFGTIVGSKKFRLCRRI